MAARGHRLNEDMCVRYVRASTAQRSINSIPKQFRSRRLLAILYKSMLNVLCKLPSNSHDLRRTYHFRSATTLDLLAHGGPLGSEGPLINHPKLAWLSAHQLEMMTEVRPNLKSDCISEMSKSG
jgi:hypothetical protein